MRSRPNKRNKDLWCHFHNDHGHSTDNCGSLKRAIEALIKRVQLRKFVAHKEGQQQIPLEIEGREDREENADIKDVKTPHDDPLVITIKAGNFDVKRVLVDNGSSAEVLFYDAFKKMNISTDRLRKMDTPLYGFYNQPVTVKGIIALPVAICTPPMQANFMLDFVVVKASITVFQASNNEAEFEALLTGIRLEHAPKVDSLSVHSDPQLVVNHVLKDYEARDERMAQYFQLVKTSASKFKNFTIRQIP
ncbi:hypothetical protein RJ639_044800 [Escallonia herrerae]|uniref:RNase H type-1 domain-containing protein n=1 Tax=Escallonia herrerae TaxID=1293975 RepID=A0AA89B165_9ASTE|nr:hypothetical protein RJ639_044800 [Escallonia herrerae]